LVNIEGCFKTWNPLTDRSNMPDNRNMTFYRFILVCLLSLLAPAMASAQARLLFDGDFESGTFQGWIPSGEKGGFASVAAKGSCFSGNDTTAISFNGNDTSNYAALLRSNAAGDTKISPR